MNFHIRIQQLSLKLKTTNGGFSEFNEYTETCRFFILKLPFDEYTRPVDSKIEFEIT